jgi:hypothetical protein
MECRMNRLLTSILISLAAVGLVGCGGNSWHQKLTVTVNTPLGEVSGSSVSEVQLTLAEDALWTTSGYAYGASHSGEAVVVEVAPSKYLFAVLEENQKILALKLIAGDRAWGQPEKADLEKVEAHRGPVTLSSIDYPLLVTFANINDPKSVMEVKPDKLVESFGPGFALKSITLEITDEVVTKGQTEKVLPWLKDQVGLNLDGSRTSNNPGGLKANIGDANFRKER